MADPAPRRARQRDRCSDVTAKALTAAIADGRPGPRAGRRLRLPARGRSRAEARGRRKGAGRRGAGLRPWPGRAARPRCVVEPRRPATRHSSRPSTSVGQERDAARRRPARRRCRSPTSSRSSRPDTFVRPIYAGNAHRRPCSRRTPRRSSRCAPPTSRRRPAGRLGGHRADRAAAADPAVSSSSGEELSKSERPELTSAKIIISGGRAHAERARTSRPTSSRWPTGSAPAWAPRRAAVDAGYAPNDWQVGQTGKVVAPDLYIAVGISGAIQHLAGMKDCKVIVAINKDEEAPIFQVADYGLVGDLFQIVPELEKELEASRPGCAQERLRALRTYHANEGADARREHVHRDRSRHHRRRPDGQRHRPGLRLTGYRHLPARHQRRPHPCRPRHRSTATWPRSVPKGTIGEDDRRGALERISPAPTRGSRRLRHRHRGGDRERGRQAQDLHGALPGAEAQRDDRLQHLVDLDHPARLA